MALSSLKLGFPILAIVAVGARLLANGDDAKHQRAPRQAPVAQSVQRFVNEDVDDNDAIKPLFVIGDEAVPSLVRFLSARDKDKRINAARGLAYIRNQRGLVALRNRIKSERDKETNAMMCYFLAGALVEPKSEQDLALLRKWTETAITAKEDDSSAARALSASLALAMTGRREALPTLRKVVELDTLPSEEIAKAIRWIENGASSGPAMPRPAKNDEDAIKAVVLDGTFFGEGERDHTSVESLVFNAARTKVLASLEISYGLKSARAYDLVLVKRGDEWKVKGIWFAWVS